VPEKAVGWLFNFAPVLTLVGVLLLVLYVPFLGVAPILSAHGDLIVVIYALLIPALAMSIGGFASGSRYATVGAQRKLIMMMSYEVPLAFVVISFAWLMSKSLPSMYGFSFTSFSQYPLFSLVGPVGIAGLVLLLITLLIALCAELIKAPFDAPEADTELAEGILVEYSGRNLGLFLLADAVKLCAFITLIIGIFFPHPLSMFVALGNYAFLGEVLFFLAKFFIITLVGLTFQRITFARLKIDQITKFFWLISAGISLLGLLLIYIDMII
jgi:formate hydrogenlyase subunit 4